MQETDSGVESEFASLSESDSEVGNCNSGQ